MTDKITSVEELEGLYGAPSPASLTKELDHITPPYRALIEASPFLALASVGDDGLDCTPRGDPAGFVRVLDDYGREPVMKFEDTSTDTFPMTMISKRVEKYERVDIFDVSLEPLTQSFCQSDRPVLR